MSIEPGRILSKVVTESGVPLKTLAESVDLPSSKILTWWNSRFDSSLVKEDHLVRFSRYFGLPLEGLVDESWDRQLLRKRILGSPIDLPDYYEEGANSYLRSSYYIVEYLRMMYGVEFVDRVLIDMKVHPLYFNDLNRKVSVRFVNDLLLRCKQLGFDKGNFENLAGSMFLSVEKDNLDSMFAEASTYDSFFEAFAILVSYFDSNFHVDFKIDCDRMTSKNIPTDQLQKLAEQSLVDMEFLEFYRGLLYKKAPHLADLPALNPRMLSGTMGTEHFMIYEMRFNG